MDDIVLLKGNEAVVESAIRAGCRYYYGYPITPQTEIAAYMSRKMPENGGIFLQAESEIAAINMVLGTSAAGKRVMTSSSSPGISLKQECISYIAGSELPAVIINISRAGPGLGGILPAQSDYFQMVKGGGHGDFKVITLAPNSVQEIYNLVGEAFDLADIYRTPVYVVADGVLGQVMETVKLSSVKKREIPPKNWALTGTKNNREPNIISSIKIDPEDLNQFNHALHDKYQLIQEKEVRSESYMCEDADFILVSYGSLARINKSLIQLAREKGMKVGMIRPITLWPFPTKEIRRYAEKVRFFLTIEMSMGQMVEDVRLSVEGVKPVHFYGHAGGIIPSLNEIYDELKRLCKKYEINWNSEVD